MAAPRATELREGVEYRGEARANHTLAYPTPWLVTRTRRHAAANHTNPNEMALPLSRFPAYLVHPSGCESRQIGLPRFLPHLWRLFLCEFRRPIVPVQQWACDRCRTRSLGRLPNHGLRTGYCHSRGFAGSECRCSNAFSAAPAARRVGGLFPLAVLAEGIPQETKNQCYPCVGTPVTPVFGPSNCQTRGHQLQGGC